MSNHIVTKKDIDILKQASQKFYIKVELLNKKNKVLESLEGNIISDNLTVNNDSIQRRSYTCDLLLTDSTFLIGKDKKIWVDKRIRAYYGVKSLRENDIIWYCIGTFLYVNINYRFSKNEKMLSLTCVDMMAEYDGTLNGLIGGYGSANTESTNIAQGLKIPAGEDMRSSIIALLKDARIENYIVEDIKKEIPYDLEFNTGVTYSEVWTTICELYDTWEFFFDVDGTFIWREIPNCADDPVILNDTLLDGIIIDETVDSSFSGIYNVTEVWGKVLELSNTDRYAETSTYSSNTYRVNFDQYKSWDDIDSMTQIAVKICANNQASPKFTVNGYVTIPMYDGNGHPLVADALKANTAYVFRYRRMDVNENGISSALFLLGQYQCYGKYVENSDGCQYSVKNIGYEILNAVDYSGLSDDAACYNQAEYLTYASTAMQDTVTLTSLVIPWLEVNTKISYTTKYDGTTNQYIVKGFNWSTGAGTMSITLYKFLESFSFVYDRKHNSIK